VVIVCRDDVPPEEKQRRLSEVIDMFNRHALENNKREANKKHLVLVEGVITCCFVFC
jgi:tRNA A37 methylthiotransferase MiaB